MFPKYPIRATMGKDYLLIVDEYVLYDFPSLAGCIVELLNSPKVNLDHLIQRLHPKEVIADGSNYKSYIKKWKKSCKSNGIELYNT